MVALNVDQIIYSPTSTGNPASAPSKLFMALSYSRSLVLRCSNNLDSINILVKFESLSPPVYLFIVSLHLLCYAEQWCWTGMLKANRFERSPLIIIGYLYRRKLISLCLPFAFFRCSFCKKKKNVASFAYMFCLVNLHIRRAHRSPVSSVKWVICRIWNTFLPKRLNIRINVLNYCIILYFILFCDKIFL